MAMCAVGDVIAGITCGIGMDGVIMECICPLACKGGGVLAMRWGYGDDSSVEWTLVCLPVTVPGKGLLERT